MRYGYVVTTWNGARLRETLDSIPEGRQHVIVASTRDPRRPLSAAWNEGIETMLGEGYDAVIVTQDDVVLRSDTGQNLAAALVERWNRPADLDGPEAVLVTARHANHGDMFTDLVDWQRMNAAQPVWQPGPDFSCFCVDRRLFEIVGKFDEGFDPCYFEDNDMHRRIVLAGFEGYAVTPYWHYRSMTKRTDPERDAFLANGGFARSRSHYCRKWGVPDDGQNPIGRETFTVPFGGQS